jgi:2-keto-3-deoxy-L-rhamnonate aldolase RhmA
MNDKSEKAKDWKNPLFIDNPGTVKVAESLLLGESLRRKTAAGLALGTFLIELPNASTLTALALAGFDFVVLDMEHTSIDFSKLETLITAAQAAGLTALVRTWGEDIGLIGKALDVGAHGIMVPHVETPERARAIVEQARFAPLGNRGFSPLTKYDALGEPLKSLNDSTYVVVQIEGRAALERVGEIAAVPGIDAVFVGPYDLALSLGVTPGSPRVQAAAEETAKSVPKDRALGIFIDDPANCGDWMARRFSLQCVSFDGRMLANGAREIALQARNSTGRLLENKGRSR